MTPSNFIPECSSSFLTSTNLSLTLLSTFDCHSRNSSSSSLRDSNRSCTGSGMTCTPMISAPESFARYFAYPRASSASPDPSVAQRILFMSISVSL